MKYVLIFLFIILFLGCSSKNFKYVDHDEIKIYDLTNIPQDVDYFAKNIDENLPFYDIQKEYKKYYFSVWNIDKPQEDMKSVMWPFESYVVGESYGENLQLLKQNFFDNMIENSNFESYGTLNEKAVTLKESDIRSFPTHRPLFKDPSLAGEGFPFDYLQNSTIHANEPIFISHYSKDREWAYIFSSYASGWLKTDAFVILEKKHVDFWQKAQQVTIIKENEPIYDNEGKFLFKTKIGMMFVLLSEDEKTYTILTASSFKKLQPLFIKSKISKDIASKEIMKLNRENLTKIVNEVSKTNYGWGGMYKQRDCSSMLRDMFTPFGIWLPRNSYQQSKIGNVIDLKNLTDKEKIEVIKEKAIPFQTLLYKKGHVVLYIGTYDNEIIVFHNIWGIKTNKDGVDGRIVIGKPIFSSLKLGKFQENYDKEAEILKNLVSMNIITQ